MGLLLEQRMTHNIFCVTSTQSVGCTFLDWSIHWLSGQKYFWSCKTNQWLDICQNPLNKDKVSNAHNHPKNHPLGYSNTKDFVSLFPQQDSQHLYSFYPCPLKIKQCYEDLGMDDNTFTLPENWQKLCQYQKQDYIEMLSWVTQEKKIPCIFVAFDPNIVGYKWKVRELGTKLASDKKLASQQDFDNDLQEVFFTESNQIWNSMGLCNVYDQRERWALNMRPFDKEILDDIHLPFNHHWINCQDLWFDTDRVIQNVMTWLGLNIDSSRRKKWLPLVAQWQTIHNDQLKFYRSLPKIMAAITQGHDYELPSLSFKEEAIIQHCLIYQYDLNIKTWKLDKFPNNAKDIHKLLEANQHSVPRLYDIIA